jgi:two-component system alkaline phosphatase synthesis response regulator PhoP
MANPNPKKVLVVDDDEDVRRLVRTILESRGIRVVEASDGKEGLSAALSQKPSLVLLDVIMPAMDGLTMCQRLRKKSSVPILFLSARDEEWQIVEGLGLGADGYLTKPFRPAELAARVEAALRREVEYQRAPTGPYVFNFGDVVINFTGLRATRAGRELPLTPTEFRILRYFYEHPGEIVKRDELLQEIWGESPEGIMTRTVDTHIARLRKKVEPYPDDPQFILTVPGEGYRMEIDEEPKADS